MRVVVSLESRFLKLPNDSFWCGGTFDYNFWKRYLDVFDQVLVVARVRNVGVPPEDFRRIDGPGVTVFPIPYYMGPSQFICRAFQVRKAVRNSINNDDAVIMRVSSILATFLESRLKKEGRPYGVEVVGDPFDVFSPGAVKHPMRPFLRWWSPRNLRRQCANAAAAAYVTEKTLQKRYPPSPGIFSTFYSNVELPDEAFVTHPKDYRQSSKIKIVTISSLTQLYKAPDILIDAIGLCTRWGLDCRLNIIGDGKYRSELEARTSLNDLEKKILFMGQIPSGREVRNQLDDADLFILPSRTEGLPRAMIEAMARGLPCIGSTAGGIPELLPQENMVSPGDANALAMKIREILSDPNRMTCMSRNNLEKAREYRNDILRERRKAFYNEVREKTRNWLSHRQR